jgi:CheY-like chemotaxis protein
VAQDRVLVIVDDEWESVLLKRVLVEGEHDVAVTNTAREGLAKAKLWLPHCIVCDLSLPDIEGLWIARMIRLDPSPISSTPFLFLAEDAERAARLQSLNLGDDLFLTKPYRTEEAVAKVGTLMAMVKRMDGRMSFGPLSTTEPPAVRGDLAQVELTTVFALLEMERQTGILKARTGGGETASFELLDGALVRSAWNDRSMEATELLRMVFGWTKGRFWFRSATVAPGTGPALAIGPLLLESLRLLDEAQR